MKFYIEAPSGRAIGVVEGPHAHAALSAASSMFPGPSGGWLRCGVYQQIDDLAQAQLAQARDLVAKRLSEDAELRDPTRAASEAHAAAAFGFHAIAAEWFSTASALCEVTSGAQLYGEQALKCIRHLDPSYRPWLNIRSQPL